MVGMSIRSKYALAVVLELALVQPDQPVQIKTLASSRSVPKKYLEQILIDLKKQGVVKSTRGAQGGYQLAMSAESIKVSHLIIALEGKGSLSEGYCGGDVLKTFWKDVEKQCESIFDVSIAELVAKKKYAEQCLTFNI